jgi:tyramine---L-glutamate ligase
MRIFVYEHITGGGFTGRPLPATLAHDGDSMLRALIDDLTQCDDAEITTSRDSRLAPVASGIETLRARDAETTRDLFQRGVDGADATWLIAPETGGVLEHLTGLVEASGKIIIGSDSGAVRVTGSKWITAQALSRSGIPVVPTYFVDGAPADLPGAWVIKPDDGAGCVRTRIVPDRRAAMARLHRHPAENFVAQPWLDGESFSLSLLAAGETVSILAVNRQRIIIDAGYVQFHGVTVNAIQDQDGRLLDLAKRIVYAVPGLCGYFGVDYVCGAGGPVVMEINPRLTFSYCGLRRALGINPAQLILQAVAHRSQPVPVAHAPACDNGGRTVQVTGIDTHPGRA